MLQPVIKWSGSKRSQAEEIIRYFPREINTYYEPFCGGASVLNELLHGDIKVIHYACSDINSDLINLWIEIKENPKTVISDYDALWHEMNDNVENTQIFKRHFYEKIRDRFNTFRNPHDFLFLDRTCFNGLIRYNSKGLFNSPFHLNRNGIKPDKMEKIIYEWSNMLNEKNVIFKCISYDEIKPNENDFIYLDPPYANTKGMYYDGFDKNGLFEYIGGLKCKWALSYDGISGKEDSTYQIPSKLYSKHVYIKSGNSSFKRIVESDNKAVVYESLYLK